MSGITERFPASVSAIIFDDQGVIHLVSPNGQSRWQVITGSLKEETIYVGIVREIHKEFGKIVRPPLFGSSALNRGQVRNSVFSPT